LSFTTPPSAAPVLRIKMWYTFRLIPVNWWRSHVILDTNVDRHCMIRQWVVRLWLPAALCILNVALYDTAVGSSIVTDCCLVYTERCILFSATSKDAALNVYQFDICIEICKN
jgi:hypothetical protein